MIPEHLKTETCSPDAAALTEFYRRLGSLHHEPLGNQSMLVTAAGELLAADAAFYYRRDQGTPIFVAEWNTSAKFAELRENEANICDDIVRSGKRRLAVLQEPSTSPYFIAFPNTNEYMRHTYLSTAVHSNNQWTGTLGLVFVRENRLNPAADGLVKCIANLIGMEENRLSVIETLRRENAFRRSIEAAMQPGVIAFDLNGHQSYANHSFCRMVGWNEADLLGASPPFCYMPVTDETEIRRVLYGTERNVVSEIQFTKHNGDTFWAMVMSTDLKDADGQIMGRIATVADLTRRKHEEHQLRSLATELSLAEERERRRLVAGLHDEVGQNLALCRMRLADLNQMLEKEAERTKLREVQTIFEQTSAQIRTFSFELSPPVLYELGLAAALEWLCESFTQRYGVRFRGTTVQCEQVIDEASRILFFCSARELFNNIAKHAEATEVIITLKTDGLWLELTVADNGKGFDPEAVQQVCRKKQSLGLFSIRERMRHIGGDMVIVSSPQKGTSVVLRAPLAGIKDLTPRRKEH